MVEASAMSLDELLNIFRRRKWSLILPMMSIIGFAFIVAVSLPSIYRSSAVILVEEREIPEEFVAATISSYADRRLQLINKKITSFSSLLEINKQLNIYSKNEEGPSDEAIVRKMADDISLIPLSAEVLDRRTGRPQNVTISFELAYEGKDPVTVQRVADFLATKFLEENKRERVQQVEDTSTFLENEIEKINQELSEVDSKIAAFKKKYMNELPEMLQMNIQMLDNVERNLELANQQMRTLKEQEAFLRTQLAGIEPYLENDEELTSRRRLEDLKIELVTLSKRFSDEYPDVINTKSEIKELEAKLRNLERSKNSSPDNPFYITLSAQHASVQAESKSLEDQVKELNEDADKYRRSIMASPNVEDEYNDLLIVKNNKKLKYDDLSAKLMEARLASGLEKEQKGEKFTLLETPRLPVEPYKPNRKAILFMGFFLGIGAGVGTMALREYFDDRIYDADTLIKATKIPVLAGIPVIGPYK